MRAERQVLFWLTAAAMLILVVAVLQDILLPFVAGVAIAYFLAPVADRLVEQGSNRVMSALIIIGVLLVIVIASIVLLVPVIIAQVQDVAVSMPGEVERIKGLIEVWARQRLGDAFPSFEQGLHQAAQSITDNWTSLAGWAATSLWTQGLAIVNFLALMLVTPLVVFYLLVDWHPMLAKIDHWLPRDHAEVIRNIASEMNEAVAAFVRGQGTVCIVLGVFYSAGLALLDVNYAMLIGLMTGLLSFVPFVGWMVGFIAAMSVSLVQFWPDPFLPIVVAIVFSIGHVLDGGILTPKIVGSKVGLHPLWVIFSLFVATYLFGVVGALVAVPLAAALGVLVRFALRGYLESAVYKGREAQNAPKEAS